MKWAKEILINLHAILVSSNDNADFVRNAMREIFDNEEKLEKLIRLESAVVKFVYDKEYEYKTTDEDDKDESMKAMTAADNSMNELFKLVKTHHQPF